ncbi:MAG: phosphoethanolamine transferase [Acidaminococcaceae bacterium]|nr:phosphoethanolamine transferase [Acidaminococcaceae bacterium]
MAILQTNFAEALGYVKDRTGIAALLLAAAYVLTIVYVGKLSSKIEVKCTSWRSAVGIVIFLALNIVLMIRTGDNFVTSIFKETRNYQANYEEYMKQKESRNQYLADIMLANDTGKPGIYILVIGESQNPTRMSAYGYKLNTTPWLNSMKSDDNMLLFQHAYACQVQTVPALTYALTAKNQYNSLDLKKAVSLIDVAKAAGYQTVWLSNQVRFGSWGTPVTVIAEEADEKIWTNSHQGNTLDTEYYDGELINRLQNIKRSDKMLIVMHLMGNHISYHSCYPAEFEKFKKEGKRSEYDNSILYNDHVMELLLNMVSAWKDFKGLVYFSDHGEAVNYGKSHNPDTFIFDMAYIPMYIYLTPDYRKENPEIFRNLHAARDNYFTNDLIFNTVLGIMGIQNDYFYEPENDLTSVKYNSDLNRFMTLYGKKHVSEDVIK